jgi:aminoglycoside phosphotransferase (APT) family kinase protein
MSREYRVQTALGPVFDYVPRTIALCEDSEVIGTPFYLMERLDGIVPRKDLPPTLTLTQAQVPTMCTNIIRRNMK